MESPTVSRMSTLALTADDSVVYSTEVPGEVKLLPLPEDEFKKGSVKELQAFDDFRVRILPVIGPLPAIFGLNIATYILFSLAGKPFPETGMEIKGRKKIWSSIERSIGTIEQRFTKAEYIPKLSITTDDIGYVFEDLNYGRGTFPPHLVLPKPSAVRWDPTRELTVDNIVIVSPKDAEKHEKECLIGGKDPVDVWGREVVEIVKRRQAETRKVMAYRRP